LGLTSSLFAKKYDYSMTIYKFILNGDTLEELADMELIGLMKTHTKRLPMTILEDGSTLHIEMWITKEGVAADRFTVFQHKYYTKKEEYWKLITVTQRLKFKGDHLDRGHYKYFDPKTKESLEIFYDLTVKPHKRHRKGKKTKSKGRGVD
jgi:hypothetical protein